jgi:oligo-1,6-glucosidase
MTTSSTPLRAAQDATDAWWKRAVVYQIYPRSFADANGDGVGDLPGIISKLDYLGALGADVLWLSPIYPSPQDDNGYDVSNYQDIDPMFGTLADFDELVAEARRRNVKIIMDLVVNHSSDEHPWFIESRSSRDNPKRDWYWWRPAREGMEPGAPGAEPTNWGSIFSGPAWAFDETTGEYYLHLFSRKQPDLNWENPEVRNAIYEMMRWWLDRGVDGFRMDVINMISKDVALPDGQTMGHGRYGDGSPYFICGPRIHEFLLEMHQEVFAGREADILTVGEMPGVTIDDAVLFTDPNRHELNMVFQFEHMDLDHVTSRFDVKPLDLLDLKASLGRWQEGLEKTGWNSLYWNNHDQPRVVSRFGNDGEFRVESAKMLGTILHMHRGTPYVYQGEELGMTNTSFASVDDFLDIQSRNFLRDAVALGSVAEDLLGALAVGSRDNARTPMQWDGSEHGGFTTGTPWFPVNPNTSVINAAAAMADDNSVFHFYRRLIALRHELPVVALGHFTMLLAQDPKVYAFTRSLDGVTLLVLGNFSSSDVPVELPDAAAWASSELLLGNYPTPDADAIGIVLRPWETRVYRQE